MGRRGSIPAAGTGGGGGDPTGPAGGHLSGTYPDPGVAKANGASIPPAGSLVTGNAPYVSGASAWTYSALDLAGGTGWVSGVLPVGNQAAQVLGGEASGTTAAVVVLKIHGATVPAAGALVTGNGPYVSGVSALTYSALSLDGGAGWVTGVLPKGNQGAQDMAGNVTGTTAASVVAAITGASGTLALASTAAIVQWASTSTAPTLNMATHATAPQAMTIQAGNVTTGTGSALNLTTGTGSVAAGSLALQTGGTTRVIVAPTLWSSTLPLSLNGATLAATTLNFGDSSTGNKTPATAGMIRFPYAEGTGGSSAYNMIMGRASAGADYNILQHSGDGIIFGTVTTVNTSVYGATLSLTSPTTTMTCSGVDTMVFTSTQTKCKIPIKGDNISTPFSVHGQFTQAMADAPQTISAANSANHIFSVTGVNTATRALTLTCAPTAGGWKIIDNQTTAFGITVQFSTGAATGTIAVGKNAIVWGDGTNAQMITFTP